MSNDVTLESCQNVCKNPTGCTHIMGNGPNAGKKITRNEGEALYPNAFVCDVNVLKGDDPDKFKACGWNDEDKGKDKIPTRTGGASGPFCGCYGTNNLNEGQLKCDFMTKTKPDIKKQSESNCYINNDASCGEQGAASGDGNKNESSSSCGAASCGSEVKQDFMDNCRKNPPAKSAGEMCQKIEEAKAEMKVKLKQIEADTKTKLAEIEAEGQCNDGSLGCVIATGMHEAGKVVGNAFDVADQWSPKGILDGVAGVITATGTRNKAVQN